MAKYKDSKYLKLTDTTGNAYDHLHRPGDRPNNSGIYRCEVCGLEITHNVGESLPPQNDHQHPQEEEIRWRLVVYAETKK
jgi:hypothetical protein